MLRPYDCLGSPRKEGEPHSPRTALSPTSPSSQSRASETTGPTTAPSLRHSRPSI